MHNIPWPATSDENPIGFSSATDPEPFDMGGLRPIPVASMWPVRPAPTLRDILPAARRAGWVHRRFMLILDYEHAWDRGDIRITWDPNLCRLGVSRRMGNDHVRWWDHRLSAYLDPEAAPLLDQALAVLDAIGIDVPG